MKTNGLDDVAISGILEHAENTLGLREIPRKATLNKEEYWTLCQVIEQSPERFEMWTSSAC